MFRKTVSPNLYPGELEEDEGYTLSGSKIERRAAEDVTSILSMFDPENSLESGQSKLNRSGLLNASQSIERMNLAKIEEEEEELESLLSQTMISKEAGFRGFSCGGVTGLLE